MSQPTFKVVIVGGSVTGLTLAHCLAKLGIDFTILEKRPAIVVQEGASIAVMPNGARVLDQLGIFDAIEQSVAPLDISEAWLPEQNGFNFTSDYPRRLHKSMGYAITFMERQQLLEILHESIPDKSKIHVNKVVTRVEQTESGAQVHTADGHVYEADMVVGADGVHSKVLREMWRMMGQKVLNGMAESESKNMTVDYSCAFGISHDVPEIHPGEQLLQLANGHTIFVVGAKGQTPGSNIVFWFLIWKLDRTYAYHDAPRFTDEEAVSFCEARLQDEVKPGVPFERLWKRRYAINMVCLQESVLQTWAHGRVVCIGDSVHKMTINFGQGANSAIEDVTQLANMLHDLLGEAREKKPSYEVIDAALQQFYKQRLPRLRTVARFAASTCRVHAQASAVQRFLSRYVMPRFGTIVHAKVFSLIAAAPYLTFLPLKRTSFPGWNLGEPRKGSSGLWMAATTLALLALAAASVTYGWKLTGWLNWHLV